MAARAGPTPFTYIRGVNRSIREGQYYNSGFMSQLLEGKTALILGIANKWSLAYAIAQAYRREGAELILTYQGERQRQTVEELGAELGTSRSLSCDVTQDADLQRLTEGLQAEGTTLDNVVHSIAFANREDLGR